MTLDSLLIKGKSTDNRDIVSQCCSCNEFLNKDNEYIKLSDDLIKEVYDRYLISHGYCIPCITKIYPDYKEKCLE